MRFCAMQVDTSSDALPASIVAAGGAGQDDSHAVGLSKEICFSPRHSNWAAKTSELLDGTKSKALIVAATSGAERVPQLLDLSTGMGHFMHAFIMHRC